MQTLFFSVLTTGPTTGPTCISECGDLLEGTYQSCVACNEFHDCREGGHIIPCPADLIWDDNNKRCEYTSVTCTGKNTSTLKLPSHGPIYECSKNTFLHIYTRPGRPKS